MQGRSRVFLCLAATVLYLTAQALGSVITLDPPQSGTDPTRSTTASAVSGSTVVGYYRSGFIGNYHGFSYNAGTYTTLDYPSATQTFPGAVSGTMVVGDYDDSSFHPHGFIYDGVHFTSFEPPAGTNDLRVHGLYNGTIVGFVGLTSGHGFSYDGSTYTLLDYPGATSTSAEGIYQNEIVGYYVDAASVDHGFIYDGSNYTSLDFPGAQDTFAYGISGGTIVGAYYINSAYHGFVYDGSTFSTFDVGSNTQIFDISGNTVVGSANQRGFLATVPEPSTVTLCGSLLFAFAVSRRR